MATQATTTGTATTQSASYERFAGLCAILGGIGSILYSIAFVFLKNVALYSILLMVGGVLTSAILVAVYQRVRATDAGFASLALLLGVFAALGSLSHGAYDLANTIHPEASPAKTIQLVSSTGFGNAANELDARGVLTFGLAGVALLIFSWLIVRGGTLPRGLGYLGLVLGVLLVVIYLGRLIVLDPTTSTGAIAILAPAALTGLILNPVWLIWLGATLWRGNRG